MSFQRGFTARVHDPPRTLAAQLVRLTCPDVPVVESGQTVEAGEPLTRPQDPTQAVVIAPVAGTVGGIIPWRDEGGRTRHELTLWPRDHDAPTALPLEPPRDTQRTDHWLKLLRGLGPWRQPRLGADLLDQCQRAHAYSIETVICVGLDAFPPYPDRSSLIESYPDEVAAGTRLLADLLHPRRAMVLADRGLDEPRRLRRACRRSGVRCELSENVYPDADPTRLVLAHGPGRRRKRMLPHGADPATKGVLLVEPWHVIRLGRWLAHDAMDLARPYFIGWTQPRMPMRVEWAFPGQPLSQLAEALGGTARDLAGRAVIGNPMTGRRITAPADREGRALPPVTPDDEPLLALLTEPVRAAPDPCIHCGWCTDVCPTGLQPIDLAELAEQRPGHPRLANRLPWCIDCGLCSHVCPSHIPLAELLRDARRQQQAAARPNPTPTP